MKLTVNNIDRELRVELGKTNTFVDIANSPDGVFLEWSAEGTNTYAKQVEIFAKCVKDKIPLIVFDRNHTIPDESVSWLVGNGAFLWEPAVANRSFFSYQPVWGRIKKDFEDIPLTDYTDAVDLGHMSSLAKKIPTFKNYYQTVAEIGEYKVAYFDTVANGAVNKKVADMNIPVYRGASSTPVKATILLGSDHDYQIGNLDPKLFEYLENGIVPMLPREHRWFHGIFDDLVVDSEADIDYILKFHDKIAFGCIYDVYRNLDAYLPECNVENVAKRINKYFS